MIVSIPNQKIRQSPIVRIILGVIVCLAFVIIGQQLFLKIPGVSLLNADSRNQANFLLIDVSKKIITYALWFMTGLFLVNTLGNILSKNKLEKRLFTTITLLLAIFSLTLALTN